MHATFEDDGGNLISDYLSITNEMRERFGMKTIVFLQVGTFWEIYDITKENSIQLNACENILNMTIGIKKHNNEPVYLCGMKIEKEDSFRRNICHLLENGYTVVKMGQRNYEGNDSLNSDTKYRKVDCIYSPGCNIMDENMDNNTLVCIIVIENDANDFGIYYSFFDVTLGKVEYYFIMAAGLSQTIKNMKDLMYEIEACNEAIIYYKLTTCKLEFEKLCQLDVISQHMCDLNTKDHTYVFCTDFQTIFFKDIYTSYNTMSGDILGNLGIKDLNINTRASIIFLLRFVRQHEENLVQKLYPPVMYSKNDTVKVSCINSLFEKIDLFTPKKGVYSMLCKQKTKIGERLLRTYLRSPISEQTELNDRYEFISYFTNFPISLDKTLSNINDIERLQRKIGIDKGTPSDIFKIYTSLKHILELNEHVNYISLSDEDIRIVKDIIYEIDSKLDIKECLQNSFGVKENSFQELFTLYKKKQKYEISIDTIIHVIESQFTSNILNIHKTPGGDSFLQTTAKRGKVLEDKFNRNSIFFEEQPPDLKFTNLSVSYKHNTATIHGEFEEYFDELNNLNETITKKRKEIFLQVLDDVSSKMDIVIDTISMYVAKIDVFYTLSNFFREHGYIRPTISLESGELSATELRHPLVERIVALEGKTYVANDIILNPLSCWMLYGVNSVGKSSLLKSIIINVILAQSGMFVAANSFVFNPFHVIGCRIGNNDDIFCGQSSFVKEALEMDLIFRKAMKSPSLIITDEMCSSTETTSALKVIASFIQILSERRITFACATHLFELQDNKYICGLKNIKNFHLSVEFKEDVLVFTRKLKEGLPSCQNYGVMVAKTIIHDNRFRQIVESLWHNSDDINDSQTSRSLYNKSSLKICCQICQYKPIKVTDARLHTHHIKFQCTANEFGNVGNGLYKHDRSNLVTVCQICHVKIHNDEIVVSGYKDSSNGTFLDYFIR